MTIKQIIQKVHNRLQRIKDHKVCFKKMNALAPLNLQTYDGGNEGLHPSCLYFHDGWNGFKFWFVFTPYKGMNDAIENPCMYVSNDGEQFLPLDGANPLDDITLPKEQEYNSDPELVYNSDLNRLECWWRRVQRTQYPTEDGKNREIIYRRFTYDGKFWSEKQEMLNLKNPFDETRMCISPAILYENGIYHMWCSSAEDFEGKHRTINYYEMKEGSCLNLVSKQELSDGVLSHIDVIKHNGQYWLVGNDVSKEGMPLKLYSSNQTLSMEFKYQGIVLTIGKQGHWDDRVIYRPSVTEVEGQLWLFYSAYGHKPNTQNHVGVIKFDDWDILKKCFLQ